MADDTADATTKTADADTTPADAATAATATTETEPEDVGGLKAALATEREERKRLARETKQLQQASQAQLDGIAKALGLKPADADPVKLAAELEKARTTARTTAVELAVFRTAGKKGLDADPDALLDSRGFLESVADLDPQAADFGAKVETAIKDAVRANPKLKATGSGPSRSGPDGPPGGTGQTLSSDPRVADLQQIEADLRAGARRR